MSPKSNKINVVLLKGLKSDKLSSFNVRPGTVEQDIDNGSDKFLKIDKNMITIPSPEPYDYEHHQFGSKWVSKRAIIGNLDTMRWTERNFMKSLQERESINFAGKEIESSTMLKRSFTNWSWLSFDSGVGEKVQTIKIGDQKR